MGNNLAMGTNQAIWKRWVTESARMNPKNPQGDYLPTTTWIK